MSLSLNCLVFGDDPEKIFTVKIDKTETFSTLKDLIKEKKSPHLHHVDAPDLELWKVDLPLGEIESGAVHFGLDTYPELSPPFEELSSLFDDIMDPEYIHTIAKAPAFDQGPSRIDHVAPSGAPNPLFCQRTATVSGIWQKLMEYNLILVRGTPGTGKTVLASLLEHHARVVLPNAQVIAVDAWPPASRDRPLWHNYLTEEYGWILGRGPAVFIFDEAQRTYSDGGLWLGFFKNLREDQYVVLLASYGSVTSAIDFHGALVMIPARQKITLQNSNYHDGLPAVGLFFTKEEFNDLVRRKYSKHCFDETFFIKLFEVTGGHIGAICDFINIIEGHDAYRTAKHSAQRFSWETFCKEIPPDVFLKHIEGSSSAFSRGLPRDEHLQDLSISETLSTVLCDTVVNANEVPDDVKNGLTLCVCQGWLHNDNIGESGGADEIVFSFPTSLHRWYVEWKLFSHREPKTPLGVNIVEFVVSVIRLFDPRILSAERRIGPGCIQRMPEARYQDEFYRCGHVYSSGSLLSFPEFGTATGRADFYVQSKKWGVELLRNGDQFTEHSGRFSQSAAYGGTLAIDDYVVLDCRVTEPRKPHQDDENLNKLYHVVFKNNFEEVVILDNMLQPVDNFRLLSA